MSISRDIQNNTRLQSRIQSHRQYYLFQDNTIVVQKSMYLYVLENKLRRLYRKQSDLLATTMTQHITTLLQKAQTHVFCRTFTPQTSSPNILPTYDDYTFPPTHHWHTPRSSYNDLHVSTPNAKSPPGPRNHRSRYDL